MTTEIKETFPSIPQLGTLVSGRGLAAFAGCSPQVVKSRLASGDLVATARLSNGTLLFRYEDAAILQRKF
jgi:hypothetical protein